MIMNSEQHRYFIELMPESGDPLPRWRETEARRQQAALFVETFGEWLKEQELDTKVSTLAITALGQVQITCEAEIIGAWGVVYVIECIVRHARRCGPHHDRGQ